MREPGAPGRVLDAAEGTRAFDGVAVRDAEALDGPLICFVGDLVGDYISVSIYSYTLSHALNLPLRCCSVGSL